MKSANLDFVGMIKGYASKLYGYEIGHAPANPAPQRVTKEKPSPCVFASTDGLRLPSFISIQLPSLWLWISTVLIFEGLLHVPAGYYSPTLYHSLQLLILQSFTSPAFRKYQAQTTPYSDLYCRKFFTILILQLLFSSYPFKMVLH